MLLPLFIKFGKQNQIYRLFGQQGPDALNNLRQILSNYGKCNYTTMLETVSWIYSDTPKFLPQHLLDFCPWWKQHYGFRVHILYTGPIKDSCYFKLQWIYTKFTLLDVRGESSLKWAQWKCSILGY